MILQISEWKNISEDRINELINNQVPESKIIEYKEQLPEDTKEAKIEFLADVSSFANADGGNIIFGIKENKGVPVAIIGVEVDNPDLIKLKYENMLRDCVEPRIQGFMIISMKLVNGKYLFILYILKSFNPPHVVKIGSHWRFYSRNSAGKYALEVAELKSMINLTPTIRERIQNFRLERISLIKNHNLQIPITDKPKFITHLIPLSSFFTDDLIDIVKFDQSNIKFNHFPELTKIYNYEGILIHNHQQPYQADWYIQIFRSGAIEVYNARLHKGAELVIYRNGFEKDLIDGLPIYFSMLKFFNKSFPVIILYTVLDIKNYSISLKDYEVMRAYQNKPFVKDDMLLPEIFLDSEDISKLPMQLKPLFDQIWNAAGHPQSPNFNINGEWNLNDE